MSRTPPPTLFVSAALAALLSACGGTPAPAAPSVRPAVEAPKAAVPAYDTVREAAPAYQAPAAAAQARQAPVIAGAPNSTVTRGEPARAQHKALPTRGSLPGVAAPAAGGPRPIAGDIRAPLEPTPISQAPAGSTFQDYGVNPPIDPLNDPLSTFALDVDSGAYAIARDYINRGQLPPFEAVRAEEFINYFAQDYTPPTNGTFAILADGAPSPFHRDGSVILRIGVQGEVVPDARRKPAALTFVIDVSGSMAAENRLGLVKQSLTLLVENLRADDSVAIVVYGDRARVALGATSGRRRDEILNAIYALRTEGSTNTESGLRLGYQLAAGALIPGGINRVILCSDGVANAGNTDAVSLIQSVRGEAPDSLMLTTIGFGLGNYNDVFMEQLADKGNGFYAYVDTIEEARVLFLDRLTNSLQAIARDARAQVVFNPETVQSYRLIGYENRAVADIDFRNDAVDAGELNSGHNATALYQLQLRPRANGRLATVALRWQDPDSREMRELSGDINTGDIAPRFESASARYQLDAIVAEYAEILRHSPYSEFTVDALAPWARNVAGQLPQDGAAQELAQLVASSATLR